MEYLTCKDPTLHEAPLRAEIMDLGNGQSCNRRDHHQRWDDHNM